MWSLHSPDQEDQGRLRTVLCQHQKITDTPSPQMSLEVLRDEKRQGEGHRKKVRTYKGDLYINRKIKK